MTQPKLIDLADKLRQAGCSVEEIPNWKTTSRTDDTSTYKSGSPNHIMWHHTATNITAHQPHTKCFSEARNLQILEPNEPICNLAICPHGVWFVIAAGPTNTNGLGKDVWHSVGDPKRVPDNSMNSYALGIEMLNNGVGEPYSDELLLAIKKGAPALCKAYMIGVFENRGHYEWAPTRKVDPAGPSPWVNNLSYNKWDMNKFRTSLQSWLTLPNIPPGDSEVEKIQVRGPSGRQYVTDRFSYATALPEWHAEFMRDVIKASCMPDMNPWPISVEEENFLSRFVQGSW